MKTVSEVGGNPRVEKTGLLPPSSSKAQVKHPTFRNGRTVRQRPAFSLEAISKATYWKVT